MHVTGQRGQVLVVFAGALVALMMLAALVVDIGWYWSNGLKLQRAADAAALAGAVYLPDNFSGPAPNAQTAALAAARRNGYIPDANTIVTSWVDTNNPRQLDVSISAKVGTFFMKVAGIQTLDEARSSKAEFVLPVPMGSPQNYYGLGTFLKMVSTSTPYTSAGLPSATGSGSWTSPGNAYTSNNTYSIDSTNNDTQIWRGFTFGTIGSTIDGLTLALELKDANTATCQVRAEVSWNAGGSWANLPLTTPNLTTSDAVYALGSTTNAAVWGSNHSTWATGDFTTANNFQVRLTHLKGAGCGLVSLDQISATVYSHTLSAAVETAQTVNGPTGSALTSEGYWGAVITKGGSRENGDQWAPFNDVYHSTNNPDFNGKGVDYEVVIGGPNGQVQLFDPTFCETGPSSGGGLLGAGDHWIAGSANGVTTIFSLFDENGTPYNISDDISMGSSGALFANQIQADYSGAFGTPGHGGLTNCASDIYHNVWYQLASGLPAGSYRLNVSTNVAGNDSTNAENMWSVWASSSGATPSRVYGQGKMVTYNNLVSGTQVFYLAQIDQVHAGKTMEIKLFDPGDVGGNAYLRILSPDGNAYSYSNFTWTANNGRTCGACPTSTIQTASSSSGSYFQDALITISIALPSTYGSTGLTPSGEPGAGWWKIEYQVNGGNDTTSWQVDIQGNPVHLLVP